MSAQLTPFPLDGGRVGDGGAGTAPAGLQGDVSQTNRKAFARTPTPDLSPIEGERRTVSRVDRFERSQHTPGTVARARRLRREMTLGEKILWRELRSLDLHVRRQAPIGRFVVDFVIHSARLVIEVDGPHHGLPDQAARDSERDAWLKSQGYRVIRFLTADVLKDAESLARQIGDLVPPPPSPTLPPSRGKGE